MVKNILQNLDVCEKLVQAHHFIGGFCADKSVTSLDFETHSEILSLILIPQRAVGHGWNSIIMVVYQIFIKLQLGFPIQSTAEIFSFRQSLLFH